MFTAEDDDDEDVAVALAVIICNDLLRRADHQPLRTSILTGASYTTELLEGAHRRCYEVTRFTPIQVLYLKRILERAPKPLHSSRHVSSSEKLLIFLTVLAASISNRTIAERYQHSGSTISL